MATEFRDFSIEVKAALDDITRAWLHEAANEVAAHAQRNCKMDGDIGRQLRGSYETDVDEGKGEASIGSPMEAVYWEEFGTGSHAVDKSKGRKGWWVYVKDGDSRKSTGGKTYASQAEAQEAADFLRSRGLDAYATNGRDPQYTLQNAFTKTEPKAVRRLETMLERGIGK